jgi:hypothetical protein
LSTESHLINVANTATSNNMRANEIAIKTAEADKVTVAGEIMSIFFKKKISADQETFLRKQDKASYQRN